MPTSMNITVSGNVPVDVEEMSDRWAVYVNGFSFYAYGHTRDEAMKTAHEGVTTLLQSRKDNLGQLIGMIDASGLELDLTLEVSRIEMENEADPMEAGTDRDHLVFSDSWRSAVHA